MSSKQVAVGQCMVSVTTGQCPAMTSSCHFAGDKDYCRRQISLDE